jgi:ATP adenylyltransferase
VTDLAATLDARTARALARGALEPIATEIVELEQDGARFEVRVVAALARKRAAPPAASGDPFGPWEEDVFVADLSDTHVLLLNKYPVIERHALVVTRAWEDQEGALGLADFEALARARAGLGGLGFYNAGAAAGASQRHKHLQVVPLPLGRGPEPVPLATRIAAGDLPFAHARAPLAGAGARELLAALRALARGWAGPYNLLLTDDWMLFVPRAREAWEGIAVNALGFAGALLVRDRAELERLRRAGPLAVLRGVGLPPGALW